MTNEQMIQRLVEIIVRGEKHANYARTVHDAELYRKLITGEKMESLMRRFSRRESEEQFEQRVNITQHITKTVSQNIIDVYYKIPRSNSVMRGLLYTDNSVERLAELNSILGKFWGTQSLDDYMNTRWIELNFVDPNAFVAIEWGAFDNTQERAKPYPFEVYSENAIMYEYKNNILQYLTTLHIKEEWVLDFDRWVRKPYELYTLYGDMQTIQFKQITDVKVIRDVKKGFVRTKEMVLGNYFVPDKSRDLVYEIISFPPHNLGFVPAERVGVKRDLATDGASFVSPLDKGIPVLMKMIKANSELDLTMALHAFPQKIQYASPCRAQGCKGGATPDGTSCGYCHGSGYELVASAQEAITLAMPRDRDDMADLTNIIRYEYPPVELVRFQETYINNLTYLVKESIFNTEIFSRQQVAETATGKNISLQNVYDALYPIANGYSKMWKFLVDSIADVTDLKDGLIAFYNFSKDFKLKTLTDLYIDLKAVGDARASEFIKGSIEDDIAGVIYSESERDLKKYNVKKSWFPFNGKSPEQIATIVASNNLITEFTKVFWANFGYIFDMIELELSAHGIDFYSLARDKQWDIIKKKVDEITEQVEEEAYAEPNYEPSMQDQPMENRTEDETQNT